LNWSIQKARAVIEQWLAQAQGQRALHEAMYAETRAQASEALERFAAEHEAKYPKAADCVRRDQEALLTFFDFPAEHWRAPLPPLPARQNPQCGGAAPSA